MIECLTSNNYLNNNPKFCRGEANINRILLTLHEQLEDAERALLEQLSEAYAHQYGVVFAEGFYSATELTADLLRIRYSHSETDERFPSAAT